MEVAVARIQELQRAFVPPAQPQPPVQQTFASALQAAQVPAAPVPAGGGARVVALAAAELGQAEAPPGSNDSPRIAEYRSAVPGGGVGPWCAYFTSWVAAQSGTPLGDQGQGFGRVDDVWAWAQSSGRAIPSAPGVTPQPGDLIVWDEHIGIVEAVLPDGRIQTIEGNSSDQVARRTHAPGGGIVGFVRL